MSSPARQMRAAQALVMENAERARASRYRTLLGFIHDIEPNQQYELMNFPPKLGKKRAGIRKKGKWK